MKRFHKKYVAKIKRPYGMKLTMALSGAMLAINGWAGLLYEPSNYAAQDNLVVNLDGIRNAGLLKVHDLNAENGRASVASRTTPRSSPKMATRVLGLKTATISQAESMVS